MAFSDRHDRLGGSIGGDWGELLHGQLYGKCGDGRVSPQLLRHKLRTAMAPCFVAVISHHLPPKSAFST